MKIFDTHTHLNVEEFAGREAEEAAAGCRNGRQQNKYCRFWSADHWARLEVGRQLWSALCYDWLASDWGWDLWWGGGSLSAGQASSPQRCWLWARLGWTITGWPRPRMFRSGCFDAKSSSLKSWTCPCRSHTDALEDTYETIKSEGVGPRGAIMHSYSGSLEMAEPLSS